jgi:hypothetical protein
MTHDLVLSGCVPTVLGSYLKALAIHRLVSEQLDPARRLGGMATASFAESSADRPPWLFLRGALLSDADRHAVER